MARRAIIDTNIVLRYLLGDDPIQSPEAVKLIDEAPAESLHLSVLVIAEVTWVLHSHFAVPREQISLAIQRLIAQASISCDDVARDAVVRHSRTTLDFADCALSAASTASGLCVVTYDKDFGKFPDVNAVRPSQFLSDLKGRHKK